MKIKLFIAASVLFITAYLAYSYIYQGHRDVLAEKATISLTSEELFENFNNFNSSHFSYTDLCNNDKSLEF